MTDLPDGQSKFSTFEVDTRVANKPLVNVKVIIDGVEAWNVTILGSPLKVPAINTGLGGLGLSLLELLGFKVGTSNFLSYKIKKTDFVQL